MINIHCMPLDCMPAYIASACADLCHSDSEMQSMFNDISEDSSTRMGLVAYAWLDDEDEVEVVGWATITLWQVADEERVQLQVSVAPAYRRKGVATALCACLTHDMPHATTSARLCVYSDEVMRIARKFGWHARQYRSVDDGWIGVADTDGRDIGTGADEERLHADAPEVRSVPLASEQAGEET
jgi:hypothetical protein